MIYQDDRAPEQRKTHPIIVLGTDHGMSGWGKAKGGPSFAGWACTPDDADAVERWVRNRGDMTRVRIVAGDYRPPSGPGHCHVYVVDAEHPARRGEAEDCKQERDRAATLLGEKIVEAARLRRRVREALEAAKEKSNA